MRQDVTNWYSILVVCTGTREHKLLRSIQLGFFDTAVKRTQVRNILVALYTFCPVVAYLIHPTPIRQLPNPDPVRAVTTEQRKLVATLNDIRQKPGTMHRPPSTPGGHRALATCSSHMAHGRFGGGIFKLAWVYLLHSVFMV